MSTDRTARYELVDLIASGDFAKVYRARDRELGREVAIKQIHPQFLADARQLARYWQEAQLLASLQHPNILTIYDIDRPRGCLILELARGNLKPYAEGDGIDLDVLRVVLASCLSALHFLHTNGVIHGDVKPSNILLDPLNRVKLGDFGLARRASNEEGSRLKGTTKYMAPELVSDQFGPVGPASDLYSLGFSAYELMCGKHFETLFPGLGALGRDRQIAWMMWHSAADRVLPPISRVLQGVPEDLARVVERLSTKDPRRRYQSAAEAIRDLTVDSRVTENLVKEVNTQEEAAKMAALAKKRRMRLVASLALAFSLILCIAMLLPPPKKKIAAPKAPEPTRGVIRNVYADERKIVVESLADNKPMEIAVKTTDRVFINDKTKLLRDLQVGDRAVITLLRDDQGRRITEVHATRALAHKGHIKSIKLDEGLLTLAVEEGDDQGKDLVVSVPANAKISLNEQDKLQGKPIKLADLRIDDRGVLQHVGDDTGRRATELAFQRVMTSEGVLRDVDLKKRCLTIDTGTADAANQVKLTYSPTCEISINDKLQLNEKVIRPADLKPGDKVKLAHDAQVVRINAYRILGQAGVLQKVHYDSRTLDVLREGETQPTMYLVGPKCQITLGGEEAELTDLRDGDMVDITHDSPDAKTPTALAVSARRPPDPGRWVLSIGGQQYDDKSVVPLAHAVDDAKLVRDALVRRYAVPEEQAVLLTDESQVRLEQGIPEALRRAASATQLIVYVTGHAYKDADGKVYLAPKNFDMKRMGTTGLALQWLVDQLEASPVKDKLLLLDCSHAGQGAEASPEPSTLEMMQTLKAPPGRSPLKALTAVTSGKAGQRGLDMPDHPNGRFAWCLAEGFAGKADKNRDRRLEATELFGYLTATMGALGADQTPVLILPDARPPRLSEEAKAAIRKLAAMLRQEKIPLETVNQQYTAAQRLANKEIEPRLIYGLLLLKGGKYRDEAIRFLETLRGDHPDMLLPLKGLVWLRFDKRTYTAGVGDLAELVTHIPKPAKPGQSLSDEAQQTFVWVGQLREYAAGAVQESAQASPFSLAKLDDAVAKCGDEAVRGYNEGRAHTRKVIADFDKKLADADDEAAAAKLRIERHRLFYYASFPFDQLAEQALSTLDRE